MFRRSASHIVGRLSDAIDDMLIGDFDYVFDGEQLFADVDYTRRRLEHAAAAASVSRRRAACAARSTPAVGSTSIVGPERRRRTAA